MKAILKALLCAILILSFSLPALAEIKPSDKTYEAGKIYALTEENIDLAGLKVYAPGYALSEIGLASIESTELVEIGAYEDFASSYTLTLRYASDDLSTLMFEIGNHEGIMCLRNNRLIACFPNFSRGVEDTYRAFEKFTKNPYLLTSRSGMTFSNDGRYALFLDSYRVLTQMRYEYQLIILDVEAGQYYLAYTWPTKANQDMECVVGACFDETDEHIYIKAYGKAYGELRNDFLVYDMKTGEMKPLKNHPFWVDYSNVFALSDGSFVHSFMPMTSSEPCGIVTFREKDGKWVVTANNFHTPSSVLRTQMMDVSKYGQGLMLLNLQFEQPLSEDMSDFNPMPAQLSVLSLPNFSGGTRDLQTLILFDETYSSVKRVSLIEYKEQAQKRFAETYTRDIIYNAALSPDGKYALVLIGNQNNPACRIINTETLEISPVVFEEGVIDMKSYYGTAMSADYPVGIQLIANDLVLINTQNGVRLFRIG